MCLLVKETQIVRSWPIHPSLPCQSIIELMGKDDPANLIITISIIYKALYFLCIWDTVFFLCLRDASIHK